MEWFIICSIIILAALFYSNNRARNPKLKIGQVAPNFKLPDQNGQTNQLADFIGKWVVLYFYPKDDTPGCTKQACNFRDDLGQLTTLGAEVIGISLDDTNSHANFAKKYQLHFKLLSDDNARTAKSYNSLISLGVVKFARRNTFLINPQGKIVKIYLSASASGNTAEVVTDLKKYQDQAI